RNLHDPRRLHVGSSGKSPTGGSGLSPGRRSPRIGAFHTRIWGPGKGDVAPIRPIPLECHVSDINWNVELRKIVREYDGLPPERSRTQIRLQKIQEIVAKDRLSERLTLVGIW